MTNDQTTREKAQGILDLAEDRLRDERTTGPNTRHDLGEIITLARGLLDMVRSRAPEWCENCPFAKFVHWECDGKLVTDSCPGFAPKVTP